MVNRQKQFALLLTFALLLVLAIYIFFTFSGKPPEQPVMRAQYSATPVNIDGVLDDKVWRQAASYPLNLSKDNTANGRKLIEPGFIKLAWDKENLYLAVDFSDSDIVAEGEEDQIHHYKFGDLAELFLKPADRTWYWELYVTPRGKKTTFWFPGRGRLGLESNNKAASGLQVAASCSGTLNEWKDNDKGWTAEMAMPVKDLTALGQKFGPGSDWTILIGRYNYGVSLPEKELSTHPQLSKTSYHLYEEYAKLIFENTKN